MILIRSLIFKIYYPVVTALISTGMFFVAVFYRPWVHVAAKWWSRSIIYGLKYICGVDFEFRGLENLPKGGCIVASKHQSAWDTAAMFMLVNQPIYILKKELTQIPFFGWFLINLGMVPVDRSGHASALKQMVRDVKNRIDQDKYIIIFPEGTRTLPGGAPQYQPGIAALYTNKQIKAPVVPVALNTGIYWPKKFFLIPPGKIIFEVMPAIEDGLRREAFLKKLQKTIESKTYDLMAESQNEPAV